MPIVVSGAELFSFGGNALRQVCVLVGFVQDPIEIGGVVS